MTDAELQRVKTQWRASQVYERDSVMGQAQSLGSYWVMGMPVNAEELLLDALMQVTPADVQRVAGQYFGDDQLTVGTLVPQPRALGDAPVLQLPFPTSIESEHEKSKNIAASAWLVGALAGFGMNSAWAILPIQHWTQPSGAQVWLVESPNIPMVDVQVMFDAGARRDPQEQAGLSTAVSMMLDKG